MCFILIYRKAGFDAESGAKPEALSIIFEIGSVILDHFLAKSGCDLQFAYFLNKRNSAINSEFLLEPGIFRDARSSFLVQILVPVTGS